MISYDELPQKQQLILQVLTAHWQLGHTTVDFPIVLHPSLAHLEKQGLITFPGPGSLTVVTTQSTAAGRAITPTVSDRRITPVPANARCAWCTHSPAFHDTDGCHFYDATNPRRAVVRCNCSRNREQALTRGLDRATLKLTSPDAARDIIRDIIDPSPCTYDHLGHCLTHLWKATGECPQARAKAYLRATTTRLT